MLERSVRLWGTHTFWVIAISFALISVWICGFTFGLSNNVFHIPYVLRLDNTNIFSADQFYQTLKYFTSAVWPLLRLFADEANAYYVFLAANLVSRSAAFIAIYHLIRNNGIASNAAVLLCLGVIAVTPWMRGVSDLGGHGMFIDYFTHTELTWPFVIAVFLFLQKHEIVKSGALMGIAFAINAFVGLWLLGLSVCAIMYNRHIYPLKLYIKACVACGLFALPVVIWIIWAISSGNGGEQFSFIAYIRAYYPNHFLIEAAEAENVFTLGLLFVCGLIACRYQEQTRFWIGMQLGCLFLFVSGILLPYLINARLIFNLHLLRSDGLEQAIAIILTAIAGTRLLVDHDSPKSMMLGALILALLAFPYRTAIELIFIIAALSVGLSKSQRHYVSKRWEMPRQLMQTNLMPVILLCMWFVSEAFIRKLGLNLVLTTAVLALLFAGIIIPVRYGKVQRWAVVGAALLIFMASAASTVNTRIQMASVTDLERTQWNEFAEWIRHSDIKGEFLLPPVARKGSQEKLEKPLFQPQETFQHLARRPVWVDWKQGAAIMWYPAFHKQWMARYSELASVRDAQQLRALAVKYDLNSFIVIDGAGCPLLSKTIYTVGKYALCQPIRE